MADVRLRTTAAAMLVVAVALVAAAVALVVLMRGSVRDGLETTAEQRASALLQQRSDVSDDDDFVWQVRAPDGTVTRSGVALPDREGQVNLPGGEHPYVVATADDGGYRVAVAVSLEDVDDSTEALLTPLLVGVPLLVLLVGGTTWVVASRALAPVERIRREVEEITGDRLDRRVPEPGSRDEIGRLARTMNRMLGRLQDSRDRQREFVADASHELRSPVAGIRQAAEVARTHPGALPDGELADTVLEETARLQRLVDQLLLLTRADDGGARRAHHDVDLDDLALSEAKRLSRTGLKVDTAGVGAGRIRGDSAALAQLLRNLTDNAARHATTTVAVGVRTTSEAVELTVDDDGPGIPADQRERVFDRFVRLDEARARDDGGSGLGLAIVRAIVTAHSGVVTASPSDRGGARFTVRFPR
ncbi:sensor histidine kinase [Paractinoplanes brasiliensis]|uniref:histidine kinase n=1 Tax=Paractinoplanes brasiliensis TaxID=52695 RepID=A0A4R6JD12_9ACTN|nr:HAMP domain-containing sensor histidine kinase [Actinoplanes brasiliensis]TDO32851.1 signal transduction histidine kinase [Actinoplanes brasiliensis]GID31604.1 two-component sensor histidine kinase [Actinoplanes brasiliensis]